MSNDGKVLENILQARMNGGMVTPEVDSNKEIRDMVLNSFQGNKVQETKEKVITENSSSGNVLEECLKARLQVSDETKEDLKEIRESVFNKDREKLLTDMLGKLKR